MDNGSNNQKLKKEGKNMLKYLTKITNNRMLKRTYVYCILTQEGGSII